MYCNDPSSHLKLHNISKGFKVNFHKRKEDKDKSTKPACVFPSCALVRQNSIQIEFK